MNDTVITVENLSKVYAIRHQNGDLGLRHAIHDFATAPLRWLGARSAKSKAQRLSNNGVGHNGNGASPVPLTLLDSAPNASPLPLSSSVSGPDSLPLPLTASPSSDFWALRGLNFEIKRGEVVGIIGRNGAGKSTLLKILSRITEPTEGRVRIRGRVASLLEVGTGFHPELTGRENIFVNGAILGMTRAEIQKKFDEIIAFAEIEKFLDTPVKRYSSGMYVRLAFAVAAHLEPEILIVDEVLAVGDAEFQKKCLGKMRDVSKGGRTVLFVSHNMAAVQALCDNGLLLHQGALVWRGQAKDAITQYLKLESAVTGTPSSSRLLSKCVSLTRMESRPAVIQQHQKMALFLELEADARDVINDLALLIHAQTGELVALIDLRSLKGPYRLDPGTKLSVGADILSIPFVEGEFSLSLYINSDSVCRSFMDLCNFTVVPAASDEGVVPREPQYRGMVELKTCVQCDIS